MKPKILLIIMGILILMMIGQSIYFNYRLKGQLKYMEKQVEVVKDSISAISLREAKVIDIGKSKTRKAVKQKKSINDKLKQDESDIDNRIVSDDALDNFLTGFED